MTIFNQGWIGMNGEPITGKVPARVLVHNTTSEPVTKQQDAEVFHAYKLFCDAVRVSAIPDGYHVQNRFLADGSRIRLESINGVHKVQLWPVSRDGEVFVLSGIGIAFTLLDGSPVEGWSLTIPKVGGAEGETEVVPQPLILSPVPAPGVKPYVSSGRWRIEKVPELIGGQHLWVSSDRNDWLSTPMEPQYATPFPIAIRTLPTRKYPKNNDAWIKLSGRIGGRVISSEGPSYLTAEHSIYTFKSGDSVIYKPEAFATPMFAHKTEEGEKRLVAIRSMGDLLRVYSGPRKLIKKLHKNDAVEAGQTLEGDYVEIDRPLPNNFTTAGVEPSPDGKHFVVMTTSPTTGLYCLGTIEGDEVTVTYDNIPLVNPTTPAATPGTSTSTLDLVPNYATVTDGPATCPPPGGDGTGGTGTVTGQTYLGTDTSVTTNVMNINLTRPPVRLETLQSLSYGAAGELVPTITRTLSSGQLVINSTFVNGTGTFSQTSVAEQTTDWIAPKRTLRTSYAMHNETKTGAGSGNYPVAHSGVSDNTQRTILFYDHDLDFIVYLEDVLSVTLNAPSTTDYYAAPLSTSVVSSTRTVRVVAALGPAEVFSHVVAAPASYRFNANRGPQLAGFTYEIVDNTKDYTYTAIGTELCPGYGSTFVKVLYDVTLTKLSRVTTATFSAGPGSYIEPVLPNNRPLPDNYFHVEFARDPRTLALIVNLQFRGANFGHGNANESWIWAVDQTGFKTLNELLDIDPAEKLIVWEKYNFNSLVSI